jgi:LemA protein
MTVLYVVVGLAVLTGLWLVVTNNSFIKSRNKVDEAWSGIDVQLKRRHDLVPNLVETVKGYAAHESATLAAVTQARSAAMSAGSGTERAAAEELLGSALQGVRVVAEQYPELRATENFQQLSRNLSELEDEIQASRRIYNSNVQAYNTKIQIFPNSVIANQGGFTPREFFEIDDATERDPVAVDFSSN